MMNVIAASRQGYEYYPEKLESITKHKFVLINRKEDLTFDRLKAIQPQYVFFPHWSYIVPSEIYRNFESIIFHMTDVPFGRGGSPLQNLIARGIYETQISALKCVKEIDAGPVYLKKPLPLYGNAEEIYMRAAKVIEEMIIYIVQNNPKPADQEGEITHFQRRKPEDGNVNTLSDIEQVFDYIRMLDAAGYPKAFLETEFLRFEFERASLRQGHIIADVKITKKKVCDG